MRTYTNTERARLGGLAAADKMTAEEREHRARKGGEAFVRKYGRAEMLRLARKRWGPAKEQKAPEGASR